MKRNAWLYSIAAALAAVTALAQDTTPAPATNPVPSAAAAAPAGPAPATTPMEPAPAKRRKVHRRSDNKREALESPVTATVKGESVNVRGKPDFAGEVLGHLQKGETVTVVAEISHSHPSKEEPAKWAEIVMPTNIVVWLSGEYVSADHTVKAHRINLRGGPGENYSVVGKLEKGSPVVELQSKNGWIAVAAPTNAFAYVAAEFLDMQPVGSNAVAAAPTTPTETPASPTNAPAEAVVPPPTNAAPVAPAPTPQSEVDQELAALHHNATTDNAPTNASAPATPPTETPAPTVAPTPEPAPAPTPDTNTAPVEPRIVTREGLVHKSYNIQAPADFELRDVATGELIDYLQPTPDQKFKIYVGTRIDVTGAEVVDPRWPRTPVLQVSNVILVP